MSTPTLASTTSRLVNKWQPRGPLGAPAVFRLDSNRIACARDPAGVPANYFSSSFFFLLFFFFMALYIYFLRRSMWLNLFYLSKFSDVLRSDVSVLLRGKEKNKFNLLF
jgi:hypothetical protein